MLLSLNWLREFTPYEGDVQALADRLTMLGLEVEDIHNPFEDIKDVVVGHVLAREKHPDADKLSVCSVDLGLGEPVTIVCGAPNVAAGQYAPVAKAGTALPGGLTIKKSKIRGQESNGMICSEKELGLAEESEGILVLSQEPGAFVPGTPIIEALALDDCVIDVSITPNRADCLSVLGLAREVAAAFKLPLTMPPIEYAEEGPDAGTVVSIEIDDPDLCPVYRAKVIEGVTVGKSPAWMRYRLIAVGQRPISNVVDVTNYVLFELGQPEHSFDLNKIEGAKIIVKLAGDGEKCVTLDGQERLLTSRDLLIRDAVKPVGLAGVMGGANSEMGEDSADVLLECAVFKPASIRKTARRLGIPSEASYRFERGVDQPGSEFAMHRATRLILKTAGGRALPGAAMAEPKPWAAPILRFRPAKASALLGVDVTGEFCGEVLTTLGCAIKAKGPGEYAVTPPSYRLDLEREVDLIEEVGRVYGMDRIPPTLPRVAKNLDEKVAESEFAYFNRVREWAVGAGLREAVNYSFVGHADLDLLALPADCRVSVANPLSEEQNVMRPALAPGLLQTVRHNLAQGNASLRVFEVAKIFHACETSETTCKEHARLGLTLTGARNPAVWPWTRESADYADIKGLVEQFLASFKLPEATYAKVPGRPWLAPEVDVRLDGVSVGFIGRVKDDVAEQFHARQDVWLAELDLDALRAAGDKVKIAFRELPKFPPIRRDLTLVAPKTLAVADILGAVKKQNIPLLEELALIDVFTPEQGAEHNLTFRMTYRHESRTLKDKDADKAHQALTAALTKELPVRLQ